VLICSLKHFLHRSEETLTSDQIDDNNPQHNESTFFDHFWASFALVEWVSNRRCSTKKLFALSRIS
jgi:hypothetical protein